MVKNAWDKKKSLADNLTSMGLVVDPNTMKNLKIPSAKVTYPAVITQINVELNNGYLISRSILINTGRFWGRNLVER